MFEWIPIQALEHYFHEIYPLFVDRLSKEDFIKQIYLLGEKKANDFYRACLTYSTSQKCLCCGSQDNISVALCLLCTSIETVSEESSNYPFEVWLVKTKLNDLEYKNKKDLKKSIQSAHKEYLEHPMRMGKSYDFKKFLIDHSPNSLHICSPIKYSLSNEQNTSQHSIVSFEDSVEYIYSRFRSPYMHKGIRKGQIPENFKELSGVFYLEFYDKKKKYYHTDLLQLPKWFSKVVLETLFDYLMKNKD